MVAPGVEIADKNTQADRMLGQHDLGSRESACIARHRWFLDHGPWPACCTSVQLASWYGAAPQLSVWLAHAAGLTGDDRTHGALVAGQGRAGALRHPARDQDESSALGPVWLPAGPCFFAGRLPGWPRLRCSAARSVGRCLGWADCPAWVGRVLR